MFLSMSTLFHCECWCIFVCSFDSSSKKTLRIWAIFLLGKCRVLHI